MNFFGHACVASWFEQTPGFVLGAMLPDFASMLQARVGQVRDVEVQQGIFLHHATDSAFHGLSGFLGLVRRARKELSETGLAKGAARAVAHVGVELMIDEGLAKDVCNREAYLGALKYASELDVRSILQRTADFDPQPAWHRLIDTLMGKGAPEWASPPEEVAARVARTLSRHPRLAIDGAAEQQVGTWVVRARPSVVGYVDAMVTELRLRLDAAGDRSSLTNRSISLAER